MLELRLIRKMMLEVRSTVLTWAVPANHEEVKCVLLRNGTDVDSKDSYDNSPLHWALPYEKLAGLLLDSGPDTNAENRLFT